MQLKVGASVHTVDDNKIGTIDRIVLDPDTKEVTHVVVQKGFLFTEDKVVPMTHVGKVTSDRVNLLTKKADMEEFPHFEESHYVPADEADPSVAGDPSSAHPIYYYPPLGLMSVPAVFATPLYVKKTDKNIPEGSVAISEGTDVISSDGEDIGQVARVYADAEDNATHLLVSEGLFLKEKKLIPITWINGMTEDNIRLAVNSKLLDRLPEYQG